jgi:hypothetical protein
MFIVHFKKVNFLTFQTFRRLIENTTIIELFFNDKLLFFNQLKIYQFFKIKISNLLIKNNSLSLKKSSIIFNVYNIRLRQIQFNSNRNDSRLYVI